MARAWAHRREEPVTGALVALAGFHRRRDRLAAGVVPVQQALATAAAPRHLPRSLPGVLAPVPHQNAAAIAPFGDGQRQVRHECLGPAPWAQRPLLAGW